MIPAASISESVDNATMGELRGIVPIAVAMSDSDPVPSSAEVSASDSSDIDKKGESSRGKKDKRDKKLRKKAGKSGDDGRPVPAGGSQPQSEEALHHSGKGPVAAGSVFQSLGAGSQLASREEDVSKMRKLGKKWGLSRPILDACAAAGLTRFFPIQQAVVPRVLRAESTRDPAFGDVCISAPTGSGKTLAYVLPIIQALSERVVPRIRALVLVPTRELVQQVAVVMKPFCGAAKLTLLAISGSHSFLAEQAILVPTDGGVPPDVVIGTPGRLVDHLDQTDGFSLQHLRFLVVDEADRMLAQSYHNWISRLYESVFPPVDALDSTVMTTIRPRPQFGSCLGDFWLPMPKVDDHGEFDVSSVAKLPSVVPTTLRRFICSATLTTNPKKLALLALNRPQYFSTDRDVTVAASSEGQRPGTDIRSDNKGYKVPSGLSEAMLVCSLEDKPMVLLLLLRRLHGRSCIVFTGSVESTHRLTRLLQLMGGCSGSETDGAVVEFSAMLPQRRRDKIVKQLRSGGVNIVVSSDAAARGVDIPNLSAVIQYDAPSRAKTYVHRVGRTARAGQTGATVTLLRADQVRHFKEMVKEIEGCSVRKETVVKSALELLIPRYSAALAQLKTVLSEEDASRIPMFDPIPPLRDIPVDWEQIDRLLDAGVPKPELVHNDKVVTSPTPAADVDDDVPRSKKCKSHARGGDGGDE